MKTICDNNNEIMGSYCYCIVMPWLGGIDQKIIGDAGIGCEKLDQVWSMTECGKKKVDRNNRT